MTREEFIKVNIELAIDFWELNLTDRTFEIKFKELLDEYESSKHNIDKTKPNFGGNCQPLDNLDTSNPPSNNLSDLQKMDIAQAVDIEMKKFKDKLLMNIKTLIRVEKDLINQNNPSILNYTNAGRLSAFEDISRMINEYK